MPGTGTGEVAPDGGAPAGPDSLDPERRRAWAAAMESGGIGVYAWSRSAGTLWWDRRSTELFAANRPQEAPLDTWQRRVHPDDRPRAEAMFEQPSRAQRHQDEFRVVLDDGSVRHLLARTTQVAHDKAGTTELVLGVLVDVTLAREAEGRLASMLDSISDGFILVDHDYRFTFVNRQAEQILRTTAGDLLGRTIWEAFPQAVGTAFDAVYHQVLDEGVSKRFEEYYPEPLNVWLEVRAEPFTQGMVIYFQDITERRARAEERERLLEAERQSRREADSARASAERARERLAYQATHDSLTGLVNRWQFHRLGRAALDAAARHVDDGDAQPVTVMFLDLDRFKLVNDSLGHATGDALLAEQAKRLSGQLRGGDVLARQGGDEFVVLLRSATAAQVQAVAECMRAAVQEPVLVDGHTLTTTVSIGLATSSPGATLDTLLRDADVALYAAKDAGRNAIAWFDAESHQRLLERIALEGDLGDALAAGGLELHYQPSYAVEDRRLRGVEALVRWCHPRHGYIPPGMFVPLAEEAGLIGDLGRFVVEAACRQAADWQHLPDLTLWVNVSGRELRPGYAESVLAVVRRQGVAPHRVGIEVTESVLVDEAVGLRELGLLHAAGVAIAIDDFGTGYSSLSRLAMLPISLLKIDQSFVADIESRLGRASVDMVVHLARAMGIETVAEGVETPRQLELLAEAGVDSAAGYLLGSPAPAQSLTLLPAGTTSSVSDPEAGPADVGGSFVSS